MRLFHDMLSRWWMVAVLLLVPNLALADVRHDTLLADGWRSALFEDGGTPAPGDDPARLAFDDSGWKALSVPHNWQGYAYARQVVKGSRHGTAWYRRTVTIDANPADRHVFLMFEGVNSYASVWLNGVLIGRHAGGLTSFTLDASAAARPGANLLAVRVDNPAGIRDLPWAAGDDAPVNGFAEGSQPFGIFRPVHVILAAPLRVKPFGSYAWGAKGAISAAAARLTARAEIENLSDRARAFVVASQLLDPEGHVVAEARRTATLAPGAEATIDQPLPEIARPRLWSPATPILYTLRTQIIAGAVIDQDSTPYGIRTVDMTAAADGTRRLRVNGQPVFLRGIAEYEHDLGNSHAFSDAEIDARLAQVRAAGFNAFRDAHYPHNLRYQQGIERAGLMWWPQFSAHIWFDAPAFRDHFRALLADWVRERRNNPALFLWGLQNESILPAGFAREMSDVIRTLDPTATVERLIVTCNGGDGSDWNVPQNWSGTYGGDPERYAAELTRQGLVGEYGAWRALGWHGEPPYKDTEFTEERMARVLGRKAVLAESAADRSIGHFQWLLASHENPGRPMRGDGTQIWDGIHPLDHVGPANNKGLMTLWGEPTDAYYLYRALQVPAAQAPMVYLVSHTWPDRWDGPGTYSGIEAYSNCDTLDLFNDAGGTVPLGSAKPDAPGHFRWDNIAIRYDTLTARCRVNTAVRAEDRLHLLNLPPAPGDGAGRVADDVTASEPGRRYLYRINVGGSTLVDTRGRTWRMDREYAPGRDWGWQSWAQAYGDLDPRLGSRRAGSDVVAGTAEQALFQSYRYGRDALRYIFAAPAGHYRIELYFVEPWYGRAGIDAAGWRRFDVAVNGRTVLADLDIFREAGFGHAVRKVVEADSMDGRLVISFPKVAAAQAILSGIAISAPGAGEATGEAGSDLIDAPASVSAQSYLDQGDRAFGTRTGRWAGLPVALLDADWVRPTAPGAGGRVRLRVRRNVDAYLALPDGTPAPAGWQATKMTARIVTDGTTARISFATKRLRAGDRISVPASAPVVFQRALPSPYAPGAFSFVRRKGLYEAEAAKIAGGAVASAIKGYGGQGYVEFGANAAALEWTVQTGLAGRIGFALRYAGGPARGRLVVRDASGIVMATLPLAFEGDAGGWREVTVTTPSLLNAGNYVVRLELDEAHGLAVDSLNLR